MSIIHVGEGAGQELESFAIISGQSLTNTGTTLIDGNIAVWPGTSYTGSGTVTQTNGTVYLGDSVAQRIQDDLTTLYLVLEGRPTTQDLTGQDLDTMLLSPGVYNFDSSANLASNGTLTLDAGGDPNAIFIFNIGSTLIAGPDSQILLVDEAQGGNVFFRVGSSATLDTSADLEGQIVALTDISMNHSASLNCGAAWARNGSVTLISNIINICTLAGNGFDDVDDSEFTEQEKAVANALSDYVAGGGVLPIGFAILAATMTTEELAASLAQMSGEVSTGVAPIVMQSMDGFLDTVLRSGRHARAPQVVAPRDHGIPIGMVRDDRFYTEKYGPAKLPQRAQALALSASQAPPVPRNWDIWLSGYGSRNQTDGDAGLGHQERTSENTGLAGGVNFSPSDGSGFGIALSWNTASFALSNGFGSGTSDSVYIALRGRTTSDRAYVEGALAYGRSDITTDRTVTIAGADRYIGEATAETIAAHIEAGYHMGIFTPFAGLRAQSFTTPAYSETTVSGSSSYALQYDKHTTKSIRSELGVEMQWSANTTGPGTADFGLRAAWAHEFASNRPSTRSFINVPGVSFPATGATRDRNTLILAANATLTNHNGVHIDAAITTEYSRNSKDFGGSLTIGYRW